MVRHLRHLNGQKGTPLPLTFSFIFVCALSRYLAAYILFDDVYFRTVPANEYTSIDVSIPLLNRKYIQLLVCQIYIYVN